MNAIYLDYAATSTLDLDVAAAMHAVAQLGYVNPASQHRAGQKARRSLEQARERIAELLGSPMRGLIADRLIFTSGGTEANNLALFGLSGAFSQSASGRVIISSLEHPSVLGAATELERRGVQVDRIRALESGAIDLNHFEQLLKLDPVPRLVSVMLGNNETGVLQPVAEIAAMCRDRGVLFHTDAVQAIASQAISLAQFGASALTLAPHKFGGPLGVGGLLLSHSAKLEPQLFGGFQQGGLRPGTESVVLAHGFVAALEKCVTGRDEYVNTVSHMRDECEMCLQKELEMVVINGGDAKRLPHISNLAFLGVDRQQLLLALDAAGVECSTGSACASGSSEPSHVLTAMGLSPEIISSSLRLSFGLGLGLPQVTEAVHRICQCVKDLRNRKTIGKREFASR